MLLTRYGSFLKVTIFLIQYVLFIIISLDTKSNIFVSTLNILLSMEILFCKFGYLPKLHYISTDEELYLGCPHVKNKMKISKLQKLTDKIE